MILAHRGVTRDAPENTIDAFRAARRLGLDGIETDLRRTSDGALVLWHDRLAPDGRALEDLDRAGLSAVAGREVPVLEDLLDACPGLLLDLEVKDPAAGEAILSVLLNRRRTERVVVTSFHHDFVARVAADSPVPLGLILAHRPANLPAFLSEWRSRPAVRTLAVAFEYADESLMRVAGEAGFAVWVWGLDRREDHSAARSRGAAALITDHPECAE